MKTSTPADSNAKTNAAPNWIRNTFTRSQRVYANCSLVVPRDANTANPVHSRYWNDGAPLASWTVFLLGGALIGAWISGLMGRRVRFIVERGPRIADNQRLLLAFGGGLLAFYGAKIAKGCTSGQALTGGALLNVSSLVFMVSVFAAAYGLAWFVRKEWI